MTCGTRPARGLAYPDLSTRAFAAGPPDVLTK
jgi:hypothetical protein